MEPLLLGLAAPSFASTANAVGRAVTPVAKLLASPFALLLQAGSASAPPEETPAIAIEGLLDRAKALQKDLESRIQQAVKDSGVQLNFPVRLGLSQSDGALEANGVVSPQREILEAALASDPSIADDFRQLAAVRQLLSAVDKQEELSSSYSSESLLSIADSLSGSNTRFEAMLSLTGPENRLQLEFESDQLDPNQRPSAVVKI